MSRLKSNLKKALADEGLMTAVRSSCVRSVQKRAKIIAEIPDLQAARRTVREIRQKSLNENESLLTQFTGNFKEAGGNIHVAENAENARKIIIGILKEHNAVRGVKSKSMVTEEIELGHALGEAGIDAVESDLGEFIVQLAGEPPSHITAPALHRSRQSIGALFSEKLGIPYSEDPEQLTKEARKFLRRRFIEAQFAVSGANFIVAESGHIVLVENEGNARMGLSIPPLYIAVTGIEKVIPHLDNVPAIINLLPGSATGQRITSYLHLLRPTQSGEDGAGEMHLVLVDNGRKAAMNDPVLREMLLCIRCGACLNACPVYSTVGGHAYGSVYPGPMGAVWSNLVGEDTWKHSELPFLSTLCGVCREVCPVDIDIPHILLELRARASKPALERVAASGWSWVMSTSARFELAGRLARAAGRFIPDSSSASELSAAGSAFRDMKKRKSSAEK